MITGKTDASASPPDLALVKQNAAIIREAMEQYAAVIDDFVAATGMSTTRFGWDFTGDADYRRRLTNGRHSRLDTCMAVLAKIETWEGAK